jgi:hypothetical protein
MSQLCAVSGYSKCEKKIVNIVTLINKFLTCQTNDCQQKAYKICNTHVGEDSIRQDWFKMIIARHFGRVRYTQTLSTFSYKRGKSLT